MYEDNTHEFVHNPLHDFRIEIFDAAPTIDARTEKVMPRIQSWADTITSSAADDAIVVSGRYFMELSTIAMLYSYDTTSNMARGSTPLLLLLLNTKKEIHTSCAEIPDSVWWKNRP